MKECQYQLTLIQYISPCPSGATHTGVLWRLAGVSAVSAAAAGGGGGGGGEQTREHKRHCRCFRTTNSRGDVSLFVLLLFIYVIIITIIVVCS